MSVKPWEQLEADVLASPPPGWFVAKQHPLVERFGGTWTPTDKGEPDFMAAHRKQGGCLFDVKHSGSERWAPLKDGPIVRGKREYVGLQPHQRASLKQFAALDMPAGVLVRFPSGDAWLPIAVVEPVWLECWHKRPGLLRFGDGVPVVGMRWDVAAFVKSSC